MSRILLVEDEEGLSGAIREWLEDEFYVVDVVSDGLSAVEKLLHRQYELILLDWMMPGLSGADDYLTKPFNMRELSARVRALLRRPQTAPQVMLIAGPLALDLNARSVSRGGQLLKLLPKEFILLEVLMRFKGQVLSTEDLIEHVWGADSDVVPETVRSHVKALRKKIDEPGQSSIITTVHGMGYRIEK